MIAMSGNELRIATINDKNQFNTLALQAIVKELIGW